jgi:hypothetical protein
MVNPAKGGKIVNSHNVKIKYIFLCSNDIRYPISRFSYKVEPSTTTPEDR